MPKLHLAIAALLVLAMAAPSPTHAQSPADLAGAKAAFSEGKKLMDKGDYAEACVKLEASRKLAPRVGTLAVLGDCYEKLGKTASAWGAFSAAQSLAMEQKGKRAAAEAKRRVDALEGRLVKLRVVLAPGAEVPGLEVTRAGARLEPELLGTAVPVDPGSIEVTATAPEHERWATTIEVTQPGATVDVTVPVLKAEARPEPPPGVTTPALTGAAAGLPSGRSKARRNRHLMAYALGGVGLAAIATGGVFGATAWSKWSDAQDDNHCNDQNQCDQTGYDLAQTADDRATVANIAIGVGVAAVAAGVVVYLTAPSATATEPPARAGATVEVLPLTGGGGLVVSGSF